MCMCEGGCVCAQNEPSKWHNGPKRCSCAVGKNGNSRSVCLAVHALAFPLGSYGLRIITFRKNLQNKRIDGGNVLEIYGCTISWPEDFKVGNSQFVLRHFFIPVGTRTTLSAQLFPQAPPLHQQFRCKRVLGGRRGDGGTQSFLAPHPSWSCEWERWQWYLETPLEHSHWSSYAEALGNPGDSQKYRVRHSLIAGNQLACHCCKPGGFTNV